MSWKTQYETYNSTIALTKTYNGPKEMKMNGMYLIIRRTYLLSSLVYQDGKEEQ